MCSGREWPTPEARPRRSDAKRRLQEVQDLQVASVCMGIEHLMNKRRRSTKGRGGAARVSPPVGQQTRLFRDKSSEDAGGSCGRDHQCGGDHDHPSSCRLCESTLRVLSTALLHVRRCRHQQKQKQQHLDDGESNNNNKNVSQAPPASDCDACRMWSMVGERCASLGISLPDNLLFAASGNIEGGAGVGGGRVDGSRLAGGATTTATASEADGPALRVVGKVLHHE
ncbi:unnamed protein product [Ectocarpus sp. 12 AP-2014]